MNGHPDHLDHRGTAPTRRPAAAATPQPPGTHCLLDLYGCPPALLDDPDAMREALIGATAQGMATLLHTVCHRFEPQGVTAMALIAESHVAIHTWPERGYAAIDVFTCGETASAARACAFLATALQAHHSTLREVVRGAELA